MKQFYSLPVNAYESNAYSNILFAQTPTNKTHKRLLYYYEMRHSNYDLYNRVKLNQ